MLHAPCILFTTISLSINPTSHTPTSSYTVYLTIRRVSVLAGAVLREHRLHPWISQHIKLL